MTQKKALITGITGQDGVYLADLLIKKGYQVHGVRRRSSVHNTTRLHSLLEQFPSKELKLHYGDLTDSNSLIPLLQSIQPDEVYNLGAQSDVAISFTNPEYSTDVNALGALRILEGIRILGLGKKTRFYQASTSEMFGRSQEVPQKETTPFYPRSPYAVAKCYAYWITINYRESYDIFACNGILFNHESPVRGENFVTRKITLALGRIMLGQQKCVYLGNLNARRDWGHARDFVEMQWNILQQDAPDDYIIATGEQHSVRDFVNLATQEFGIRLRWEGKGLNEQGIIEHIDSNCEHVLREGMTIVKVDPAFFRPAEVETLLGDPSKAYQKLGWKPKITFNKLVAEMAHADYLLAQKESDEACLRRC